MKLSKSVFSYGLAALATMGLAMPAAQAAPAPDAVVFGDSLSANPTVDNYVAGKLNLPTAQRNHNGCPTDGTFARAYGEAARKAVADYSCAGASFYTGGKHIADSVNDAAARGDLSPHTREVILQAGTNDTYPHIIGGREPAAVTQQRLTEAMVNEVNHIRSRAPQARIKIVGLPQLTDAHGAACVINVVPGFPLVALPIAPVENAIDNAGREAARATGATFVDLKAISKDHHMCNDSRWVAGVVDTTAAPHALPLHYTWDGLAAAARHVAR
ncbi:esterase [Corynebacterium sp. zg254]|uniref:Esterase n=1 Tax=Corynebacterium zhongnanshanii TaxID=2768834 RepID=A0ABQ6VDI2_9CORY|nr:MULTISPECIES: GDSL-type esterase/lipase family protein [Corynebacterium]KAB3520973.1 esterase [Corynebacterium zhongnanshanii]MCR5914607.1 esterase [Corynebacterium sp. zg254]